MHCKCKMCNIKNEFASLLPNSFMHANSPLQNNRSIPSLQLVNNETRINFILKESVFAFPRSHDTNLLFVR